MQACIELVANFQSVSNLVRSIVLCILHPTPTNYFFWISTRVEGHVSRILGYYVTISMMCLYEYITNYMYVCILELGLI